MDGAIVAGHAEGLSAREIASQLGKTRNAVLGRTFRLQLGGTPENKYLPNISREAMERVAEAKKAAKELRAVREVRRAKVDRARHITRSLRYLMTTFSDEQLDQLENIIAQSYQQSK